MRPAGNSKRELSSAARTRSLLSFTTMAGRPTMQKTGRPLARLTSTCTSGACSPTCARQATRATAMKAGARCEAGAALGRRTRRVAGGGGAAALQGREPRLECFEPRSRALEHARLGVELVPAHQVELAQALAQHRAEVALEVLLHAAQRRRHALEQTAGDLIDAE